MLAGILILKQRKESLVLKEEKVIKFETAKDKAFLLMDKAKNELALNNFEKSIEYYKESEEIFTEISWQEGIHMVKDSIAMIKRRQQSFLFLHIQTPYPSMEGIAHFDHPRSDFL